VYPEFYRLVPKGASIEKIPIDFNPSRMPFKTSRHFTEGPVWDPRGFLLFSDIYGDKIYELAPGRKAEVFLSDAGYPNGLTFDRKGRLIICNQKLRRLERLEPDGSVTVLADKWEVMKLNCPNDVVVRDDGTIYFTDPFWHFPSCAAQELSFHAVWRITLEGRLKIAARDFSLPNGIAFSPDEKILYVDDTVERTIYAFDVAPDGALSGRRVFAVLQLKEGGAVDGMKVDERGDIFSTGPGGIWVFDKRGRHLGTIHPPEIPANLAWGGKDYRTLYLAAPHAIYRIRTRVKGMITYETRVRGMDFARWR
jgi:gluconolactonase